MKNRQPEFIAVYIQRTSDSERGHLGVMKAPTLHKGILKVPLLQTSLTEIKAIAKVGHSPHRVIAQRRDGSELVFANPTCDWQIKSDRGFPMILLTVTPIFSFRSTTGSTFGLSYANIGFGEDNIPKRWVRKVQRWYYNTKRYLFYAN